MTSPPGAASQAGSARTTTARARPSTPRWVGWTLRCRVSHACIQSDFLQFWAIAPYHLIELSVTFTFTFTVTVTVTVTLTFTLTLTLTFTLTHVHSHSRSLTLTHVHSHSPRNEWFKSGPPSRPDFFGSMLKTAMAQGEKALNLLFQVLLLRRD